MNIPAKVDYAYKAVLELALRYKDESPVQLSTICQAQNIPKKFLTQILLRLRNAHIVNSSRGVEGGYNLTRPPSQISLADVLKAVDDSIIGSPKKAKAGKASDADRLILKIWEDINKETVNRVEAITFDRLATQVRNEQFTYYI